VAVHDAVGVVLARVVQQLEVRDEVERRVAAARRDVRARQRVGLGHEGVDEVGDS